MRRAPESLLIDMREALLAELGAVATYRALAARPLDPDLRQVLAGLHTEELEFVEQLRGVLIALGERPRKRSLRRFLAARLLVGSARIGGPRFALRVCQEAEATISRWYRGFAVYLARIGELEGARTCDQLSRAKARHASTLNAWVENLPGRRG